MQRSEQNGGINDPESLITSDYSQTPFRISTKYIFTYILLKNGFIPLISLFFVSLAALAIGIFVDIRWLVAFFMILCIVAPLVMAYLYFYHALKPRVAFNILSHTLRIDDEAVHVKIFPKEESEDSKEVTFSIPLSEVRSPEQLGNYLYYPISGGIIVIPK